MNDPAAVSAVADTGPRTLAETVRALAARDPAIAATFGGAAELEKTLQKIGALDTRFDARGGIYFHLGSTPQETAAAFTRIHVEDYRDDARPSLPALVAHHLDELGLAKDNPHYKAALLVATRAEVDLATTPQYHNTNHYEDVTAQVAEFVKRNNELAAKGVRGAQQLSVEEMADSITAAVGHDLDHPGGKNALPGQKPGEFDPLRLEEQSFQAMEPLLREAGLSAKSIGDIHTMIQTTSPDGPHAILKALAKEAQTGEKPDWDKLPKGGVFDDIRAKLEADPKILARAAILEDADLGGSAFEGRRSNVRMSEGFTQELQERDYNENLRGPNALKGFGDYIVGQGPASAAAQDAVGANYADMYAKNLPEAGKLRALGLAWADVPGEGGPRSSVSVKDMPEMQLKATMDGLKAAGLAPALRTDAEKGQVIELSAADTAKLGQMRKDFIAAAEWQFEAGGEDFGARVPTARLGADEIKALMTSLKAEGLTSAANDVSGALPAIRVSGADVSRVIPPPFGNESNPGFVAPLYTADRAPTPAFDGSMGSYKSIVDRNAYVQSVDRMFTEQLKFLLNAKTPQAQVEGLMQYSDQPLAPRQIVQVAQELKLRGADDKVVEFLDAQEKAAAQNGTEKFFASPEVRQWRAEELQKTGRNAAAAGISDGILKDDPGNVEALRTRAMARVAEADVRGDRVARLGEFAQGFAKTGDYSLGMGALNAALETGDLTGAKALAPLVSLAAKNIGADQARSFWPSLVNAESALVAGNEAESHRAMVHLVEVLSAKNENGSPLVSDADKKKALSRIKYITAAQGGSAEIKALLNPVADRLEMSLGVKAETPLPYAAGESVDDAYRRHGRTTRQGAVAGGLGFPGNTKFGAALSELVVTPNDKAQFLEVAKMPLDELIGSGLIRREDLPPDLNTKSSLRDIDDVETRVKAGAVLARGIYNIDERGLEDLHGAGHRVYDSVIRAKLALAGATEAENIDANERKAFNALKDDKDLFKAVLNDNVTPAQREKLAALSDLSPKFKDDPVGAAKGLIREVELFRSADTRTNIAVSAREGAGDCRHVATASQMLFDAVQQDKTNEYLKEAAGAIARGDQEAYRGYVEKAGRELNGSELRMYDQSIKAAVEVNGLYNPVLTADGKFVAAADDAPREIETHNHNVLRLENPDGTARYVVADSFYQHEPYQMSFVQDQAPEVVQQDGRELLRTSGGYVDAVVCKRDPKTGELLRDPPKTGHVIPETENGKVVTRRTRVVLESTGYSDVATTREIIPNPEETFNGRALEPGQKRLAESLADPQRNEKYGRLAELAVTDPKALGARELLKDPRELEESREHVAQMRKAQAEAAADRAKKAPAPAREAATGEPAVRKSSVSEPAARETPVKEAPVKETPVKEAPVREAAGKEPVAREPLAKAVPAREPQVRETVPIEAKAPGGVARGRAQTGVAAFGLVQSAMSLREAAEKHDKVEAGIASVNLATSAISTAEELGPKILKVASSLEKAAPLIKGLEPAAARVLPAAKGLGKAVPGLNIVTTLADGAYQVSKEDTLKHKEERAVVVGATAAVGIGVGTAVATAAETAAIATVVGAGGAAVVAVAAPVVLAGVAVYAVGKVGEAVLENKRAHDALDEQIKESGEAGKRKLATPVNADGKPSILEYRHIVGGLLEVSPDLKDGALGTTFARGPGGRIKVDAVRGFDLSNPKNLAELERALDARIAADDKKIEDNSSSLPSWLRFSDSVGKEEEARADEAPLKAARAELEMYKKESADYAAKHKEAPAAHKDAAKPAPKAEAPKPPLKIEPKAEPKAEPKTEAKAEAKTESRIAQKPAPAQKPAGAGAAPPSLSNYKNLPYAGYVLKDTPDKDLHGRLDRTPDGFIKNFRELDMTDPKNLKAYSQALDRKIDKLQKTIGGGTSLTSSFMGGDKFRKSEDPKSELKQLQGAKADLVKFEKDLREYRGLPPAPTAQERAQKPEQNQGRAQAAAGGGGAPSFFAFKSLAGARYVLNGTPDKELDGRLDRTPDGYIKNFRDLDMSDPKNLRTFEEALARKIEQLEKSSDKGDSLATKFMQRDEFRRTQDARSELKQLQQTQADLKLFKKELQDYQAGPGAATAEAQAPVARAAPRRPAAPAL